MLQTQQPSLQTKKDNTLVLGLEEEYINMF